MGARRALRVTAAASLVALIGFDAWACFGLIDPRDGFLVQLEVTAPDSVPLGEEGTVLAQVVDETGRRVTTPSLEWTLDPDSLFGAEPARPEGELHFRALLPGMGSITAALGPGPLWTRDGGASALVYSVAQGVRLGSDRGESVVYLGLGDTLTLHAQVLTADGTPQSGGALFQWRFLDHSGALELPRGLDGAGGDLLVQGYSAGEEAVEVTHRICQGMCADTIVIRVGVTPNTMSIAPIPQLTYIGEPDTLTATVTDSVGRPIPDPPVQWALADPADSVVVRLQGNLAEARGNGSAVVNATSGALGASDTIHVWQLAGSVTLDPAAPPDLIEGQRDTIRVRAVDAGGHDLLRPLSLSAYADNPAIVAVAVLDGGIERTAQASGTTMVNVYAEGLWLSFQTMVNAVLDSLDVRLARDTLHFEGSTTLAQAWGLRDTVWSQVNARFTSSDTVVATIASDGRITAQGSGVTWIGASAGGHADSARLVVAQVVASLSIRPAAAMVVDGGAVPFLATAIDSGGYAIRGVTLLWGTSDPTVAQVDTDGVLTAVGPGSARVSVTSDGLSAGAPVTAVTGVAAAAVGGVHVCAIAGGGALYCMGDNGWGELGDGTFDGHEVAPVRAASALTFNQVAAGSQFTCAIATDAHTYCWGENLSGQLGNGTMGSTGNPVPSPVLSDPGFVSLSASKSHICGLTQAGAAYCWGSNQSGEAGVGHTNPVLTPSPVTGGLTFRVVSAAPGGETCGVAADSVAYCWGSGVSAPAALATPVRFLEFAGACGIAIGGTLYCRDGADVIPVTGGGTYHSIRGGLGFNCAVGDDLNVYCFGDNSSGQLGSGDYEARLAPTRTLLSGQGDLVAAGDYTACARKVGGGLSCWGSSYSFSPPLTATPRPVIYP